MIARSTVCHWPMSMRLACYYDHREDIDRAMRADEEFLAEIRRRIPSKLSKQGGG